MNYCRIVRCAFIVCMLTVCVVNWVAGDFGTGLLYLLVTYIMCELYWLYECVAAMANALTRVWEYLKDELSK